MRVLAGLRALSALAISLGLGAGAPAAFTGDPKVLARYSDARVGPSGFIESVDRTGSHVWIVLRNEVGGALWRIDVGTPGALAASGWDKLLVPKARVWVDGRLATGAERQAAAARIVLASPEVNILEGHSGPLTDDDIVAYASQPWSKRYWMNRQVVLGEQNGVQVVAEFPCGDICPDYTNRVIHYEMRAGDQCDRINGLSQQLILASGSIGWFCVPKVVVDRGLQVPDAHHRLRQ